MSEITTNQKYGAEFYKAYQGQYAGDVLSPEIIRLARPFIKGRVLDVGAGSGMMMKCLKGLKDVETITGIDIAPTTTDIIEASATDIPFDDEYFDCVIASEVLEHLDDSILTKAVSEIHRVLKLGGTVIITTPYKYDLSKNEVMCPHCGERFDRWGEVRSVDATNMMNILVPFVIKKTEIIPLGFMASHKHLRYFIHVIKNLPFVRYEQKSIFVVAEKETPEPSKIKSRFEGAPGCSSAATTPY